MRGMHSGLLLLVFFLLLSSLPSSRGFCVVTRRTLAPWRSYRHRISSVEAKAPAAVADGKPYCAQCRGQRAMPCPVCGGSGVDKKNGNIFERWTCVRCKGFGLLPCSQCSKDVKGLTPEQRGER